MDTYYYFAPKDRKLRYDDGRKIEVGVTHKVDPPIGLCQHGLHASRRAINALKHAPGPVICIVGLSGKIIDGYDKSCATKRTYLEVFDGMDLLSEFARKCALDVINKWGAPSVVRQYLETGDKTIQADAKYAAYRRITKIGWEHVIAAANSAYSAIIAETITDIKSAIGDAFWATEPTTIWTNARVKQNVRLERMIYERLKEKNYG